MRYRPGNPASANTGTGSLVWLFCAVFFLWPVVEATACPLCTRGRLLENYWHFKIFAVLVIAPVLVTFTRLDAVRVLYTFIPLALINIKLALLFMWYGDPAVNAEGLTRLLTALMWATTLLAPALICCLGKSAFYCREGKKGFLIWQPLAYIGVVFAAGRLLHI